ncbi:MULTISPECIES: hypothetical protein [Delftia]|uniref:Uncharacterized protein n=1 Tax=Delftia deserti TaxID=1651218 RepID=A0ABW5EMD4_9BURK|nr:hypothetical protein [Delftia sp. UME58]
MLVIVSAVWLFHKEQKDRLPAIRLAAPTADEIGGAIKSQRGSVP